MNERTRQALGFALLGLLFVVLAGVYPPLVDRALERFGVRFVAIATALVALGGFALRRRLTGPVSGFPSYSEPLGRGQTLGVLAVLAAAFVTAERHWLLALPALAYLYLAWTFWMSLEREISIVQQAALLIQPRSPDWIGPYCRKATVLWAAVFLWNAIVVGALALAGSPEAWSLYAGRGAFALIAAVAIAEFVFRKWWFRHYEEHVLDRALARIMPPEHTERGRRSLAFIRDMKARMRAEEAGRQHDRHETGEAPGARAR